MRRTMEESKYKEMLRQSITFQWSRFEYFRNLCSRKNRSLQDLLKAIDNEEYYQIPGVMATAFKKSKGLINDLNDLTQKGVFQVSSSTSGDPSYIYTNLPELNKVADNYASTFGIEGISRGIAFSPSCRIMQHLSKGERHLKYQSVARMKIAVDAAHDYYKDLTFTLDLDLVRTFKSKLLNGHAVLNKKRNDEINEIISAAEKDHEKISLGGIVLLFMPYLNLMKEGQFSIGSNAYFCFSGGGYSGSKGSIKGEKVEKSIMVKKICAVFGLDEERSETNIKDIYAFTESPALYQGCWCRELDDFLFDSWHESRTYIVDPETEMPLKSGQGLVKIITPYANGNPSASNTAVIQLDMATIREIQPNFIVRKLSHITRVKNASVEGCAFKADEISRS